MGNPFRERRFLIEKVAWLRQSHSARRSDRHARSGDRCGDFARVYLGLRVVADRICRDGCR
jgi:hypothetical protein